jgi:Fur family ferric uptake transcriptional regulator
VVCGQSTGEVRPFSDETLEEAIAAVGRRLGMRLTSHEVILRGVPDAGACWNSAA